MYPGKRISYSISIEISVLNSSITRSSNVVRKQITSLLNPASSSIPLSRRSISRPSCVTQSTRCPTMSTRRAGPPQGLPMSAQLPLPYENEKKQRSKCMSFVCCMWKVFTCIFSHVTLVAMVVAYCFLGAVTFEHLEAENERNVGIEEGQVDVCRKFNASLISFS